MNPGHSAPSITSTRTEPKKVHNIPKDIPKYTPSNISKAVTEDDHYKMDRTKKERADLIKLKKSHQADDIDKKIAEMKKEVAKDMQLNLKPNKARKVDHMAGKARGKK